MKIDINTIKELHERVKSGEIDESKLSIVMDNDCTDFYIGDAYDESAVNIDVKEANGYQDVENLWPILFPKATVEWC